MSSDKRIGADGKPDIPGHDGIFHAFYALKYSLKGLRSAWKHEAAFRQEVILAVVLFPAGYWLAETGMQLIVLWMSLMIVLITEVMNSAVEAVVDRVGTEWNRLSGRAKNMGSAAVFLSMLQVGVVWSLVAIERFG